MAIPYSSLTFLLLVCLAGRPEPTSAIKSCEYDEKCGCHTDEGYIDLTRLAQGSPYSALGGSGVFLRFYWQPCTDFTKGTMTAGALQEVGGDSYFDIGVHSKASSLVRTGIATFHMVANDGARQTYVECKCGAPIGENAFKFRDEDPTAEYNFEITSEHCCPIPQKSKSGGLSGGSILLIICLVLACVYLIGGVAFQVGVRKAEGMDRIPNVVFWSALPGLVRDGFRFTFCNNRSATYEKV